MGTLDSLTLQPSHDAPHSSLPLLQPLARISPLATRGILAESNTYEMATISAGLRRQGSGNRERNEPASLLSSQGGII